MELCSQFGAEEMCLAKITALGPQTANLVGFPSFALGFFCCDMLLTPLVHAGAWRWPALFFLLIRQTCHAFDYAIQ